MAKRRLTRGWPLSRVPLKDELDLGRILDHVGVFQSDEEFERIWNGPRRVLAVLHRNVLQEWETKASGRVPCRMLATAAQDELVLVSNDPGRTVVRAMLGPDTATAR